MIARVAPFVAAGLAIDIALVWSFGPPASDLARLCLLGVVACFLAAAFIVPREEAP